MRGIITTIIENNFGQEYGFILSDNVSYYFDGRYLSTGTMTDLYVEDEVEFDPGVNPYDPQKKIATNVTLVPDKNNCTQLRQNESSAGNDNRPERKLGYILFYNPQQGWGFITKNGKPDMVITISRVKEWDNQEEESYAHAFVNRTTPGINRRISIQGFEQTEQQLIEAFADVFILLKLIT